MGGLAGTGVNEVTSGSEIREETNSRRAGKVRQPQKESQSPRAKMRRALGAAFLQKRGWHIASAADQANALRRRKKVRPLYTYLAVQFPPTPPHKKPQNHTHTVPSFSVPTPCMQCLAAVFQIIIVGAGLAGLKVFLLVAPPY